MRTDSVVATVINKSKRSVYFIIFLLLFSVCLPPDSNSKQQKLKKKNIFILPRQGIAVCMAKRTCSR